MEKHVKTAGFILLYMATYFIMQMVYIIGALILQMVKLLIDNPEMDHTTLINEATMNVGNHLLQAIIIASIASFGMYYLICKGRKTSLFKICQFNRVSAKAILLMIPMAIALSFVVGHIVSIIYTMGIMNDAFEAHHQLMGDIMNNSFLITFIAVGVLGPIIEEIIFRGLIYKELRNSVSVTAALIIQAILFGLYHMQTIQMIYSIFIGLVFGLVYMWFKSIWAPILLHVLYNSSFVILTSVPVDNILNKYPALIFILSLLIATATFILLYKSRSQEEDAWEAMEIMEKEHQEALE